MIELKKLHTKTTEIVHIMPTTTTETIGATIIKNPNRRVQDLVPDRNQKTQRTQNTNHQSHTKTTSALQPQKLIITQIIIIM